MQTIRKRGHARAGKAVSGSKYAKNSPAGESYAKSVDTAAKRSRSGRFVTPERETVRTAARASAAAAGVSVMSRTEVRDHFADVFSRISYGHERILVRRNGNEDVAAVAMIPAADLEFLEKIEAEMDFRAALAAKEANGDEPTIPWDDVKKSLGL